MIGCLWGESESEDEAWVESTRDESETEGEPPRKLARKSRPKYTETGWRSTFEHWNWWEDRTRCLKAEPRVCHAHATFFPREHTHAPGFEVVSGYNGGRIPPGGETYSNHSPKPNS